LLSKESCKLFLQQGVTLVLLLWETNRSRHLAAVSIQKLYWRLVGTNARVLFNRMKVAYTAALVRRKACAVVVQAYIRGCVVRIILVPKWNQWRIAGERRARARQLLLNDRCCTKIQSGFRRKLGVRASLQRREIVAMMYEETLMQLILQVEREKVAGLLLQSAVRRKLAHKVFAKKAASLNQEGKSGVIMGLCWQGGGGGGALVPK
jgi:hypothetical protein